MHHYFGTWRFQRILSWRSVIILRVVIEVIISVSLSYKAQGNWAHLYNFKILKIIMKNKCMPLTLCNMCVCVCIWGWRMRLGDRRLSHQCSTHATKFPNTHKGLIYLMVPSATHTWHTLSHMHSQAYKSKTHCRPSACVLSPLLFIWITLFLRFAKVQMRVFRTQA